jgi:hypothetical protein
MERRVFVVHGWEGYPEEGWFPWLKSELTKKGFGVNVLPMPNSEEPKIEEWVPFLAKNVGKADPKTILVGGSIGCQTIFRYLETLGDNEKIAGAVLVAPWTKLKPAALEDAQDSPEIAKPWLETPIDWEKIKKHCPKFIAIFSDDDPYVYLEEGDLFKEKLGAKVIVEHKMGHFIEEAVLLPARDAVLEIAGGAK